MSDPSVGKESVEGSGLVAYWERWHIVVTARWREVRRRLFGPPVVVMVAGRSQRRSLEREIRPGLRRLKQALGPAALNHVTVVVQHTIATDHQVAGCYHIGKHADGSPFTLVRLALNVNDRALSLDEILATLTEQCISLAVQQAGGMSVIVPVEMDVLSRPAKPVLPTSGDPLTPSTNGHTPVQAHHNP